MAGATASGGPTGTGEHDLLDFGPPRKRVLVPEVEYDAAEAMVVLVCVGAAGLDGGTAVAAAAGAR